MDGCGSDKCGWDGAGAVHIFDPRRMAWSNSGAGTQPRPTKQAAMTELDGLLYVFGGAVLDDEDAGEGKLDAFAWQRRSCCRGPPNLHTPNLKP